MRLAMRLRRVVEPLITLCEPAIANKVVWLFARLRNRDNAVKLKQRCWATRFASSSQAVTTRILKIRLPRAACCPDGPAMEPR